MRTCTEMSVTKPVLDTLSMFHRNALHAWHVTVRTSAEPERFLNFDMGSYNSSCYCCSFSIPTPDSNVMQDQNHAMGFKALPQAPLQHSCATPTATWGSNHVPRGSNHTPPVQHIINVPVLTSERASYFSAGHSTQSAASELPQVPGVWVTSGSQATPSVLAAESAFTASGGQHVSDMVAQFGAAPPMNQHHSEGDQTQDPSDTFDMAHTAVALLRPPGPEASHEEKKEFLEQQLDSFGRNTPIFDDLLSLGRGHTERRQGGMDTTETSPCFSMKC